MVDVNAVLGQLTEISKNPGEQLQKYLKGGEKVIGCFPVYTPQPLVTAAGMVPMGLWGGQVSTKESGKYSPIFTCSIMHSVLEYGMRGTYRGLSAVVMSILCDTFRGMSSAWRAGVPDLPLIALIQPQNRQDPGALNYLIEEYKSVAAALEKIAGQPITQTALNDALDLYNRKNAAAREFCLLANDHLDRITPMVRHHVLKALTFLKPEESITLLGELNEGLRELPAYRWTGKKVVLTGITAEPDDLLQAFANNHVAVVGDDLAQESRLYRTDYPQACSAMERLALQWFAIRGCSLAHDDNTMARGKLLVDMARRSSADCVVLCMMRFCDIEEYDQPYLIRTVQAAGLSTLSIDIDQSTRDNGQSRTKIQTYAEN